MSKHTPGPWFHEVHELPLNNGKVISIQTRKTFDADEEDDDPTLAGIYSLDPVDFANASLIAAAPDLLEALEEMVLSLAQFEIYEYQGFAIEAARKAIARAKGEPQ